MKKLVNDPADLVPEARRGIAAAHPELRVDQHHRIVYREDAPVAGKIARRVGAGGRSMGMALTSCTVPAAGQPTFELAETEMEIGIGIGIHGGPGRRRVPLAPARQVAEYLLDPILADLDFTGDDGC